MGVNHKFRIRSSILVEKVNAKKIDLTPIIYTEQGELGAIENALEPTALLYERICFKINGVKKILLRNLIRQIVRGDALTSS